VLSSTLTTATAAHIHIGGIGANGPVSYNLFTTTPVTATRGVINFDPALIRLLENGGLYVNVHTPAFPGGEIRGQIYGPILFEARMTPNQETPPANNTFAGTALVLLNDGQNGLMYAISHTVASPTVAHIHRGPLGTAGPIVYPLDAADRAKGAFGFASSDLKDLFTGGLYVNIHNGTFPAGAIRGQLLQTQPPGGRFFAGIVYKNSP
jgi:hypothetical protein